MSDKSFAELIAKALGEKTQKPAVEDWTAYTERREKIAQQRQEYDRHGIGRFYAGYYLEISLTYPLDRLYEPWDMSCWPIPEK